MSSLTKMMSYEIEKLINLGPQVNKINRINGAIEMLQEKKYYLLEKLNDVNFDIMCINKIFDAKIEKLENKENDVKNLIKGLEKSILELEDMEKNKINKMKIIRNNTIKKLDAARMEELKNLEKIRVETVYTNRILDRETKMLKNEENRVNYINERTEKFKFKLRFMKRCKILKTELDELFLLYK